MKIIQHPSCFEVRSDDGSIVKQFQFDDNASRRAISGQMTRKQAFIAARTFAGKGHTVENADRPGATQAKLRFSTGRDGKPHRSPAR